MNYYLVVAFFCYVAFYSNFASRGTVAGAWITPFLEPKNPLITGLSIFRINFFLGAFARFVLPPILLYHIALVLGALVGFFMGFVVGSPPFLSYLSDFPSLGTMLLVSAIVFENLGYIIACAIGYKIAKEAREGLPRKQFLKLLIVPIHLKDARRRQTIKRSLSASIPWILFFIRMIVSNARESLLNNLSMLLNETRWEVMV